MTYFSSYAIKLLRVLYILKKFPPYSEINLSRTILINKDTLDLNFI